MVIRIIWLLWSHTYQFFKGRELKIEEIIIVYRLQYIYFCESYHMLDSNLIILQFYVKLLADCFKLWLDYTWSYLKGSILYTSNKIKEPLSKHDCI